MSKPVGIEGYFVEADIKINQNGEFHVEDIKAFMESDPRIRNVHHIHLWRLDDQRLHLEAHVIVAQDIMVSAAGLLRDELVERLHDKFAITHTTLQMEYDTCTDPISDCTNCLD